jgi:1,4-dihydroxy-2-naphthoyl-CoA hydrolase
MELAVPYERSFDAVYGLELVDVREDRAHARLRVAPQLRGLDGALHGGVLFAAAESLASIATARAVMPHGLIAAGLNHSFTAHAAARDGTLDIAARRLSRAEHEWVWAVEARDAAGALSATSTVVIAIRQPVGGTPLAGAAV